jgi:hypothetical protein
MMTFFPNDPRYFLIRETFALSNEGLVSPTVDTKRTPKRKREDFVNGTGKKDKKPKVTSSVKDEACRTETGREASCRS